MRNAKAIEDFIDACLETGRKMGFHRAELGKLLKDAEGTHYWSGSTSFGLEWELLLTLIPVFCMVR